jgi:hypothetical protein
MDNLTQKIESHVKHSYPDSTRINNPRKYAQRKLLSVLAAAKKNAETNPQKAITALSPFFEQRAWFQIEDIKTRIEVRDEICRILAESYDKRKQSWKAEEIRNYLQAEKEMFKDSGQGLYTPSHIKMRQ